MVNSNRSLLRNWLAKTIDCELPREKSLKNTLLSFGIKLNQYTPKTGILYSRANCTARSRLSISSRHRWYPPLNWGLPEGGSPAGTSNRNLRLVPLTSGLKSASNLFSQTIASLSLPSPSKRGLTNTQESVSFNRHDFTLQILIFPPTSPPILPG